MLKLTDTKGNVVKYVWGDACNYSEEAECEVGNLIVDAANLVFHGEL